MKIVTRSPQSEPRSNRFAFVNLGRGLAIAGASTLLLAACGGGSQTAATEEGEESSDTVAIEYESPLGEFLGWANSPNDADAEARFAEEEREREQEVAECMVTQGFEYTPVDNSQFINFDDSDEFDGAEWGSRAWAEKYGFGITTLRFSQDAVGPNLVGNTWNDFGPGEEGPEDPNQEYVSGLDESTQQAYYAALYGTEPDIDFENATEEEINEAYENWEPDGCANQGYADQGADYEKFDEEFGSLLEDMGERIEADPRLVEETQRIKDCVTEAGQTYRNLDEEMYEYFEQQMEPISEEQNSFYENFDPFEGVDFESMTPEEQDAYFAENESSFTEPELSENAKEILAELQAEEIGLASVMFECGGGQFGETEVQATVRKEYEQRFLDEHGDKLAAFEGTFG